MADKKIWVLLLVAVGIILITTPLVDVLGLTEADSCGAKPFHPDCYCPDNSIKTQGGFPFQWICVGKEWPADDTLDCAWCNEECVNWKLHGGLIDCDRTPPYERSCQAVEGYCTDVSFEYQEGVVTFCTDEDWYQFVDEFPGISKQMNSYLREHCTGTYWRDGCELTYRGPTDSQWDAYSDQMTTAFECVSTCYDADGRPSGGRVLYSNMYDIVNGEIVGPTCPEPNWCFIDTGCYDQSETQSCCYNEGMVNPYKNPLSFLSTPVGSWKP